MLEEPAAGLSPVLVDRVLAVAATLRQNGTAVLLVEQLVEKALRLADRVYAMAQGRVVMEAATTELASSPEASTRPTPTSRRRRRGRREPAPQSACPAARCRDL